MSELQYIACEAVVENGLGVANFEECFVLVSDSSTREYQIRSIEQHGRCGVHPGKGFVRVPDHLQKELGLVGESE